MRKPKGPGGWGILLSCLPLVAFGHHARFEFDESELVEVRGTPQSAAMRVVERFTLSEDETRLDWSASVSDPETFTEPVARQNLHFSWVPGEEVKPFDCSVPGR